MWLSRPGVRLALCSILAAAPPVAIGRLRLSIPPLAVDVLVSVLLVPLIGALVGAVPRRYWSNPRLQRTDLGLGPITLLAGCLAAAPFILMAIGFGYHPERPYLFVLGAAVCAILAGILTEFSRTRWPAAWLGTRLLADLPPLAASPAGATPSTGAIVIKPGLGTSVTVWLLLGGIAALFIWGGVQGYSTQPGSSTLFIVAALAMIGCAAVITRMEAGCDATKVWFMRRSVVRSKLVAFQWKRSLTGEGSLLLLDVDGKVAFSIPTTFFTDQELK